MPVSDKHVATLRAQLAGDYEKHNELLGSFDNSKDGASYTTLVSASFLAAAERKFPQGATKAEIADFVADLRAESRTLARDLDPTVAERLVQHAVGDADISDIGDSAVRKTQILLLSVLVADEQLNDDQLDLFLSQARDDANAALGA